MSSEPSIVLFDGVCNFCNGTVQFVLRRDPRGNFYFAALQSEAGREILDRFDMPPDKLDSIILIEGRRVYTKSAAALRIARGLRAPWPLLGVFLAVPRALRDACYDAFARRRYRWFGKRDSCMVPTPEMRARFLSDPESA